MPGEITAEIVLDKIAELLIQNFDALVTEQQISNLQDAQRYVTSDGQIGFGRPDGSKIVLYQLDSEADSPDLSLAESIAKEFNVGNDADVLLSSATLTISGNSYKLISGASVSNAGVTVNSLICS